MPVELVGVSTMNHSSLVLDAVQSFSIVLSVIWGRESLHGPVVEQTEDNIELGVLEG